MAATSLRSIVYDDLLRKIRKNIFTILCKANVLSQQVKAEYEQCDQCLKTNPEKLFDLIDIYVSLKLGKMSNEEVIKEIKRIINLDISSFNKSTKDVEQMIVDQVFSILKTVIYAILEKYHQIPRNKFKNYTFNGCLLLEYICRYKSDRNKMKNINTQTIKSLNLSKHDRDSLKKICPKCNI